MKAPAPHRQVLLLALALMASIVLPAQAARFRRAPLFQAATFPVAQNVAIAIGTQHRASLADLRVGERVSLGCLQEGGVWVVHRIAARVPRTLQLPGVSPAVTPHAHAGTPGLFHVHGVVEAVNVQAATVTIARRLR